MPVRNLLFIGLATLISLSCYSIAVKNRFASVFSEALHIVQKEALVEVPQRELFNAAMNGMLIELDPNSGFISADQFEMFNDDLNQEFVGVGMEVQRDVQRKCLRVVSPIPGTPAYNSGIKVDDCILKIDDTSTRHLSQREAVELIRGPRNTEVVFTISREGSETPIEITVVRDQIPIASVYGDRRNADGSWSFVLEDYPQIGYIRLRQFGKRSADEMKAALRSLDGNISGLILDLRNNPGGLLDAAVDIADLFLDREVLIVQTKNRHRQVLRRQYATSQTALNPDLPVVVIVNEGSASASEILAASLQDHQRAVVVGSQTWGKGTVQDLITLERNRSVLRLTTASYWRPSGANIDRTVLPLEDPDQYGVRPDPGYEVELTEDEKEAIYEARNRRDQKVAGEETVEESPDEGSWIEIDRPLKKAVEYLLPRIDDLSAAHP